MNLWQFIALCVPIGALLVYVGVLTARVGLANTRLKKIAEALQSLERGPVQANVTSGEVAGPGASSRGSNEHVGYKTIRDLRPKQTLPTSPASSAPYTPAQDTRPVQADRERKANGAARRALAAPSISEVHIPPYLRIHVAPELAGDPSSAATTSSAADATLGPNSGTRARVHARTESRSVSSGTGASATNSDAVEVTSEPLHRPKTSALQREGPVTTPDEVFGEAIAAAADTHYAAEAPASISVPDVAGDAVAETAEAHALAVEGAAVLMPALPAADTDAHAAARYGLDRMELILELSSPLCSGPASDEDPSASPEKREPPGVVASANGSSSNSSSEADALATKKNRDALVFLNNQRRRRRMQRAS
jgi:hypothetical protein